MSKTNEGCSPLFLACKLNHLNIVKYLLDTCDADIEQKGLYEATEAHHVHSVSPIWVAAVSGNLDIVKLLIENGANINSLSDTGSTPLRSVCFLCRDDENEDQLAHDRVFDEGFFSHQDNSEKDVYMEIVKVLVDNGAEVSKPNFNGGTCLINSIHNCRLTRYLIEHGASVDASDHQSKTALHYAIQQGRLDVTKLLLRFGADPMLRANFCDDALQLSCLGGHLDIFNYLLANIKYSKSRLIDAYKLIGSSIVELYYDLSMVRSLWMKSLTLQFQNEFYENHRGEGTGIKTRSDEVLCDIRRSLAFGDTVEFINELELQSLSADEYRIQSLLISERILGTEHRETVQRLLYRGTYYINSFMPDRCICLWIYALNLRLKHESVFHFESIFAAQAITKLILDLVSQCQQVNFRDAYDVLSLLVDQLEGCKYHLENRPVSCLHEDIFNLLLGVIANLLIVLNSIADTSEELQAMQQLIRSVVHINPCTSGGSSLLHVFIAPGIFDGEAHKLTNLKRKKVSSLIEIVTTFIDNGMEVDHINYDGLSPLQSACLSSIRTSDKRNIIRTLVEKGAHIDRRSKSSEQEEIIRQALRDADVNPFDRITLSCLAARKITDMKIKIDDKVLAGGLRHIIKMH